MMTETFLSTGKVAKIFGVHPLTVRRWVQEGKLHPIRTPTGRFAFPLSEIQALTGALGREIIAYIRVSSRTQKDDLERQREMVLSYAKERGYKNVTVLQDIGSGLNERRRNFRKLLRRVADGKVASVIVAYPDRLTRFGFGILEQFFTAHGAKIEVVNRGEERTPQQELVEDLMTIIASFAGKLYGMRSHKYKEVVRGAKKLLAG